MPLRESHNLCLLQVSKSASSHPKLLRHLTSNVDVPPPAAHEAVPLQEPDEVAASASHVADGQGAELQVSDDDGGLVTGHWSIG